MVKRAWVRRTDASFERRPAGGLPAHRVREQAAWSSVLVMRLMEVTEGCSGPQHGVAAAPATPPSVTQLLLRYKRHQSTVKTKLYIPDRYMGNTTWHWSFPLPARSRSPLSGCHADASSGRWTTGSACCRHLRPRSADNEPCDALEGLLHTEAAAGDHGHSSAPATLAPATPAASCPPGAAFTPHRCSKNCTTRSQAWLGKQQGCAGQMHGCMVT